MKTTGAIFSHSFVLFFSSLLIAFCVWHRNEQMWVAQKVPTGCVSVIITRSTECAKKVEYKFYLCTMCVFRFIVDFFSLSFLCLSCLWNIQLFAMESFDVWERCEKLVCIGAVCWLKMTKAVFPTLFMHIKWPYLHSWWPTDSVVLTVLVTRTTSLLQARRTSVLRNSTSSQLKRLWVHRNIHPTRFCLATM